MTHRKEPHFVGHSAGQSDPIIVVSGLPRSGTSLMMQLLQAGGVALLTDQHREADEDNPRGYFEYQRVKGARKDASWVKEATGKAVKVISMNLYHLPQSFRYKTIFMTRRLEEIMASQRQMLLRQGKAAPTAADENYLAGKYEEHLDKLERWLLSQGHIEILRISYNDLLKKPSSQLPRIGSFLGLALDHRQMESVIDSRLYRQRHPA